MRRPTLLRILLAAVIAGTTVVTGAGTALACSCIAPDPQSLLETTDGAFVGTLVERPAEPSGDIVSSADMVPWVFEVEAAYNGAIENPMVVFSAISGASCGFEMSEGSSASLFVTRVGDEWQGNLCQTMSSEALLESGFITIEWGTADTGEATILARWALGGIIAVGVGGLVLTRIRRSRDAIEG
jgi:hypothetical protein